MVTLDQIAIVVEEDDASNRMVPALLRELLDALDGFLRDGTRHCLDLATLPLGHAGRHALEEALGQGEIDARVSVLGSSRVRETAFTGIWWLRHEDDNGALLCEQIEVTDLPEILRADRGDIEAASARLAALAASLN